jgi:hypothetical protein
LALGLRWRLSCVGFPVLATETESPEPFLVRFFGRFEAGEEGAEGADEQGEPDDFMAIRGHKMADRPEEREHGRGGDSWNVSFFSSHGNPEILGWFVGLQQAKSGAFARKNAEWVLGGGSRLWAFGFGAVPIPNT